MRFAFCVALLALGNVSCGGGSGDCGPVREDADKPNTLPAVISENVTLRKSCSPYTLAEPMVVATGTLTLEAGTVVEARMGAFQAYIFVGKNGKIVANGGDNDPVVFTSAYRNALPATPIGGQWAGFLLLEAVGSEFKNVRIEYAGGPVGPIQLSEFETYEFPDDGAFLIDSSENTIFRNVTIDFARRHSIAGTTSEAFEDTGRPLFSEFTGVTITNPDPTQRDSEEKHSAVWLPVDQVSNIQEICFFERNEDGSCPATGTANDNAEIFAHIDDNLGRTPEDVRRDGTWGDFGVPYIAENISVTDMAVLTIDAGVEIRMTNLGGIYAGLSDSGGGLRLMGEEGNRITVTTRYLDEIENDPETGLPETKFWKGLYIWNFADINNTVVQYTDLSWGGRSTPNIILAPANIGIFGTNPTIVGNHVSDSLGMGIAWDCVATPKGLEDPPLPSTNTSDDENIRCAQEDVVDPDPMPMDWVGRGIAENFACDCPSTGCMGKCPPVPL